MKPFHLLMAIGMTLAAANGAHAQDAGPTHVVTYVEVMPGAKDEGATLVRQYRDAIRKEEGNLRAEVARRIGQPNQFVLIEAWKDRSAFDTHGKAASTTQLRDKLKAIQNAPYDERVHNALSAGPLAGGRLGGGAVYAVTHIDVIPPRKDDGTALVKKHGDDSRKDDGNLRFEILVQVNRPNHFTAVEIWRNRAAADTHGASARVRGFRDALAPMSGALYDERFYKAM
jgi:quinol monooxygenase YgiN